MVTYSYPIQMEIAGQTAIWARPDSGDSPISYAAPTYSAVKALFEAVLWGPAIEIIPTKVELCKPVQWHSYVTNYGGPLRSSKNIAGGNNYQLYATVLTDVCYRLYAVAAPNPQKDKLTSKALAWDKRTSAPGHAYQDIFNRRLKRGQSYANLCLGWREFTSSYFGAFRDETEVCTVQPDIIIPSMLRQVFAAGHHTEYHAVYDTDVVIHQGTLIYPVKGVI